MTRTNCRGICVVGPSTRFLSGITYYTFSLCNALAGTFDVSAVLMRQLLPTRLYPGRDRVGSELSTLTLRDNVKTFDGVDWFWLPSLFRSLVFLLRRRPSVVLFQWWTGTVLHSYLALAIVARLIGAQVIIELHEVLDTGEYRIPLVRWYVHTVAPWFFRLASAYVVHSRYDRELVLSHYKLPQDAIEVIPHATYDHYHGGGRLREAPEDCCNLLYFGVIRPFKGVEDLIRAFDAIPRGEIHRYWLTIVGETWENWTLPIRLIAESAYRDRITFINRYVCDDEVDGIFGAADAVVLPYHRSSQSGPLHITLNYGLPVVVTAVGGLVEAVSGYDGAVLAGPGNPDALLRAIQNVQTLVGRRYTDPRSWAATAQLYARVVDRATVRRDSMWLAPMESGDRSST